MHKSPTFTIKAAKKSVLAIGVSSIMAAGAPAALAQLEEVIVTARKSVV